MSTHPSSLQSIPSLLLNTSLHSYLLFMLNSLSTLTKLKTMLQTTWGKKSDLYAYRPWNICITGTNVKNCKYVVTYVLKCFRVSEVASELETFELSKINWILRKYFSMFPRFSAVYFNYLINYFTYLFFCFVFCIRVLLYSPSRCPGTHYAKQAVLRLRDPPVSASWMWGLRHVPPCPSLLYIFFKET